MLVSLNSWLKGLPLAPVFNPLTSCSKAPKPTGAQITTFSWLWGKLQEKEQKQIFVKGLAWVKNVIHNQVNRAWQPPWLAFKALVSLGCQELYVIAVGLKTSINSGTGLEAKVQV